jgi:hypothetical protein
MTPASRRRLFGLLLGALAGLALMLVSQYANHLLLPGIPLYQPPFGALGNTLAGGLLGALLGLGTAWPEDALGGIFLGSLTGFLAIAASILIPELRQPGAVFSRAVGLGLIFIPTAALLSIALFFFRWLVGREDAAYREQLHGSPPAAFARAAFPTLLVIAAGLVGLAGMYNGLARTVTPRMMDLVESARRAETAQDLPEPLRVDNVKHVLEYADQPYTLQWDRDESNQFAIGRPPTNPYDISTVIARFEDGYLLACLYATPQAEPRCKDFLPGSVP